MSKKVYKDAELPLFEIIINDNDTTGIKLLSLVADPAILIKGNLFSEMKERDLKFKVDEKKMIIAGPAMVPGLKIVRKDDDGNKYNVVFSADTINKMINKFNKDNNNKSINVAHTTQMAPAFIAQQFLVTDSTFTDARSYGFKDLPVGTWFTVVQVENTKEGKKFWDEDVVGKEQYGFSIEGLMSELPAFSSIKEIIDMKPKSMDEYIQDMTEEEINAFIKSIK
jgi:hypothetical protein